MPRPTKDLVERFAHGMAGGLTVRQAAREAGYSDKTTSIYSRAARKDFVAMVNDIQFRAGLGVPSGLTPLIELMLRRSQEAAELQTSAGVILAGRLLLAVAQLQQRLPKPARAGPDMSLKEWAARNRPKP